MNILIYVSTLLMILAIMTYARVENFRSTAGFQSGFVNRVGLEEHQTLKNNAEKWYGRLKPKTHKYKRNEETDSTAGSRLSVQLFLNADKRNKYQDEHRETRALLKQLIVELYSKEQFFIDMSLKQPGFLDTILNEIQNASEGENITKVEGILNLKFNDQELHAILVKMMNGLPKLILPEQKTNIREPILQPIDNSETLDTDDEQQVAIETSEPHAPTGYVSLEDFLTSRPTLKLRVFLASGPLLLAIYGDPNIVDAIIGKRLELYKALKSLKEEDRKGKDELSKAFEQEFSKKGHAPEYSHILDFTVTNTDPKKYL